PHCPTLSIGNCSAAFRRETAMETISDSDFATPSVPAFDGALPMFSDVALNPVKTLDAASEMVGVSASVLNPVKTLPRTSEGTTLSSGNFPAPLLTEAAIAETTDCDVALTLFTALAMLGASVGDGW